MADIIQDSLSFTSLNLLRRIDLAPVHIDLPISHQGNRSSFIRRNDFEGEEFPKNQKADLQDPNQLKRHASQQKQNDLGNHRFTQARSRNAMSYLQEPQARGTRQGSQQTAKTKIPSVENKRILVPSLFKNPNLHRKQSTNIRDNDLLFSNITKYISGGELQREEKQKINKLQPDEEKNQKDIDNKQFEQDQKVFKKV